MLKIGLTGGIGSGKTAVSDMFNELGIKIIDTDVISRDLLNQNQQVVDKIVNIFGSDILDNQKNINRKKLAQFVFSDTNRKQQLEAILHPEIRKKVTNLLTELETNNSNKYILIVIPLLFETGFSDLIDRTLVVIADENIRLNRVKQRDNRSINEIRSIMSNQTDDETRYNKADDIIENNNDFKKLAHAVKQLHNQYLDASNST